MLDPSNDSHDTNANPSTSCESMAKKIGDGPNILRRLKQETGIAMDAMKHVRKHHPGNALKQVDDFFDRFYIPAATGRKRTASHKTDLAYRVRLTTAVKKLSEMNMAIRNLDEMSAKQVKLMFRAFEKEGWSPSWMANVNSKGSMNHRLVADG